MASRPRRRTWSAGARRWPASPAPASASPRASTSASGSRRCWPWRPTCGWPPGSHFSTATTLVARVDAARSATACAGYQTPKVAVGAVVGNDEGEILLVQRADSGVWLYPTGWADIGYSASEVAVKEVREETGIECEVVQLIAVLDGLRLGFTRIPLYSLVFHCRAVGGDAAGPPARDRRRRAGSPRTPCPSRSPAPTSGATLAFAAIRGEPVDVLYDRPRNPHLAHREALTRGLTSAGARGQGPSVREWRWKKATTRDGTASGTSWPPGWT